MSKLAFLILALVMAIGIGAGIAFGQVDLNFQQLDGTGDQWEGGLWAGLGSTQSPYVSLDMNLDNNTPTPTMDQQIWFDPPVLIHSFAVNGLYPGYGPTEPFYAIFFVRNEQGENASEVTMASVDVTDNTDWMVVTPAISLPIGSQVRNLIEADINGSSVIPEEEKQGMKDSLDNGALAAGSTLAPGAWGWVCIGLQVDCDDPAGHVPQGVPANITITITPETSIPQ